MFWVAISLLCYNSLRKKLGQKQLSQKEKEKEKEASRKTIFGNIYKIN